MGILFWKKSLPKSTMVCLDFVDAKKLAELEKIVLRKFRSRALLAQAVTSGTCQVEINGVVIIQSNEKLEHLGDRLIGLAVTAYLHKKYSDENEGFYSSVSHVALSNSHFADVASTLGIEKYVVMRHPNMPVGRSTLADTFEAICGALYEDGGNRAVRKFLRTVLFRKVDEIAAAQQLSQPQTSPQPQKKRLSMTRAAIRNRRTREKKRLRKMQNAANGGT